jgi:CHASE1-domain containing sensor protein
MSVQSEVNTASTLRSVRTLVVVLTVLVALLLVLTAVQFAITFQQNSLAAARASTHDERAEAARSLVEQQSRLISSLMSDYEKSAYDNPGIDRIAEQQLLAAESTLAALQVIAIQNSQMIELLATAP